MDIVNLLLNAGSNINHAAGTGDTPLNASIHMQHRDVTLQLIAAGADVALPSHGDTPLHYAARSGQIAVMQMLLANGAPVNHPNLHGSTALHEALANNQLESATVLFHAGANAQIRNNMGHSAYGIHLVSLAMQTHFLPLLTGRQHGNTAFAPLADLVNMLTPPSTANPWVNCSLPRACTVPK